MATSDSIDYNLTAQQVITYALRLINIVAQSETPNADDTARALTELNLMLKEWQKYENLWRRTEGYIDILHDTKAYALTPRPYRIYDMRYRDANGIDTPMYQMNREDYYDLPDKSTTGITTQWFFDPQRDTSNVYVWPVIATDGGNSLTYRVTYQRRFEDQDALTDNIDIPQQYLGVVAYNLASRLADSYGRSGGHIERIVKRAEIMREEILDDDREDYYQFMPDETYYPRRW